MGLLARFLATVFALLLITEFVPGFSVENIYTAVIVAILLGIVSITLKPLLLLITLPINILTLGLFSFVINALMLWLVASFVEGFEIEGFVPALLGALILAVIHWIVERLTAHKPHGVH
jgi:putative membrane protein